MQAKVIGVVIEVKDQFAPSQVEQGKFDVIGRKISLVEVSKRDGKMYSEIHYINVPFDVVPPTGDASDPIRLFGSIGVVVDLKMKKDGVRKDAVLVEAFTKGDAIQVYLPKFGA